MAKTTKKVQTKQPTKVSKPTPKVVVPKAKVVAKASKPQAAKKVVTVEAVTETAVSKSTGQIETVFNKSGGWHQQFKK